MAHEQLMADIMPDADGYFGNHQIIESETGVAVVRSFKRGSYQGSTHIFGTDLDHVRKKYEYHIRQYKYHAGLIQ